MSLDSVAITGVSGFLGRALADRWARGPAAKCCLGIDRERPGAGPGATALDLCRPGADERLAELFRAHRVDAVVHTAFRRDPGPDAVADRALECEGTRAVLAAAAATGVGKIVIASSTMLYGPHPDNPNYLRESHPLRGHPGAHCVRNRIAAERQVAEWSRCHPGVTVTVLRSAWVVGPRFQNRIAAHFGGPMVTTVLGYDPLLQFLHEDDWVRAYDAALTRDRPGAFNLAAPGALPLSALLRLAGKRALPFPVSLLYRLRRSAEKARYGDPPAAFYDYLRYLWVADGARGWDALGEPHYSTREAWIAFTSARRLQRYR